MLGLSVLFHSWRAAEMSAALVTGVSDERAGVLSLYVIPAHGAPGREVDVPFWDSDELDREKAASAWRTWDQEADAARAQGRDIPATPDYPQRSWCWPQGIETTGGERADLSHLNQRIDSLQAHVGRLEGDTAAALGLLRENVEKLAIEAAEAIGAAETADKRTAALQKMDAQFGQGDDVQGDDVQGDDVGGADGAADGQFDRTDANAS